LVSWVARSEREVLVNERRTGEALRVDVLEQGPDDRPGSRGRSQRSRDVGFESASDGAEDGRGAQNADRFTTSDVFTDRAHAAYSERVGGAKLPDARARRKTWECRGG